MNTTKITPEKIAQAVALTRKLLNDDLDHLPHEITERLRASRVQALTHRPRFTQPVTIQNHSFLNWLQKMPSFTKALVAIPVIALALMIGGNIHKSEILAPNVALNAIFEPSNSDINTPPPEKLNIDAILNEQIPLQAYLKDDFNSFAEKDIQSQQTPKINAQPSLK